MALLGVNEFLSILFEGISMTYVKMLGVEIGWSVAYYIFTFITGVGFFLVVVLLGTGFNVVKVCVYATILYPLHFLTPYYTRVLVYLSLYVYIVDPKCNREENYCCCVSTSSH